MIVCDCLGFTLLSTSVVKFMKLFHSSKGNIIAFKCYNFGMPCWCTSEWFKYTLWFGLIYKSLLTSPVTNDSPGHYIQAEFLHPQRESILMLGDFGKA